MQEIGELFDRHFGFIPDIISTTEHAYVSPPSRVISSLINLSQISNKKVLRIIITDDFSINPEDSTKRICIPHILNKNVFDINGICSRKELTKKLNNDSIKIKDIEEKKKIFSPLEKKNCIKIIDLYKRAFEKTFNISPVNIYDNIIKMYADNFQLNTLFQWLNNTKAFGINSKEVRLFLKEAFTILEKTNLKGIDTFGKYLEKGKRLKSKRNNNNAIKVISWDEYVKELKDNSVFCSVPFEIILYVYSYLKGSHFGNDYNMVSDINKIQKNQNLSQMTKHNEDYSFEIEKSNVQFQKATIANGEWNLTHKMYKTIDTLPELYIVLGPDDLRDKFKKMI